MTTCTHREVVVAKGALPVVTAHTTKRTSSRVMIERLWFGDFVLLHSAAHAMTILTTQTLVAIVLGVTEADFERSRHLVWAHVATQFVTDAAGGNIAVTCLCLWAMTLETGCVRVRANRNRQRDAAASRSMATRAIHALVTRVVEFHVEADQTREWF